MLGAAVGVVVVVVGLAAKTRARFSSFQKITLGYTKRHAVSVLPCVLKYQCVCVCVGTRVCVLASAEHKGETGLVVVVDIRIWL